MVAQLRAHEDEFKNAGSMLAAIGLGDLRYAQLFREETGITFPLLVDADRTTYRAAGLKSANLLHLFRRDNSKARAVAKAAGFRQHRLGKDPFQLGASFVFAPGNRDLFVHVNETFSDDADLKGLLSVLADRRK
jgi:alkyl-hydroperoxide reductase/thiol specific antioxidant family protein